MSLKIRILLIDNGNEKEREECLESIQCQSFRNIDTVVFAAPVSSGAIKETLKNCDAEYILFMYTKDRLGIDYCRTLLEKAGRGFEIVAGETLELIGAELFFPNRVFNQCEFNLNGEAVSETYQSLNSLDNSWNTLWNKLYQKELLLDSLKDIADQECIEELGVRINTAAFYRAKSFSNARHNYYYRRASEKPFDEYKKEETEFVTKRYVKVEYPLYYEEMKQAIQRADTKIVSFDVFDTLLLRPFLYPVDLFIVLEQYVNTLIPTTDGIGFQKIRMSAEAAVRRKIREKTGVQDVTLEQIYDEIARQCSFLQKYLEPVKNKEIELELQYCYPRNTGKELYDFAQSLGKTVIFLSDMYLSEQTIRKLSEKNGYHPRSIFVSSECGKTKASGDLYPYTIQKLGCEPSGLVHIGDNMETDVVNAKKQGIRAFHLPRTEEMFNNWNPQIFTGRYFSNMFESRCGIVQNYDAKELLGIRCMMAVSANKLYDYPFVFYNRDSDFNGNPYTIGYFTLGMHIYAIARWLIDLCLDEKYENLHFMSRDGYLVKKAFQELSGIFSVKTTTYYTHMSRKALMPFIIQSREDCYNLVNEFNGVDILPRILFDVIEPVIKKMDEGRLADLCGGIGVDYHKPIGSYEKFLKLSELIATRLFDPQKAETFRRKFDECFRAQFSGKTATFDMGYSGRSESVLKEVFGYDITANYIHTCLDRAYQRRIKSSVKINCFYDFTPYISGIARELLLSEQTGSCIGYQFEGNTALPLFEDFEIGGGTCYAVSLMQEGALDFVRDMVKIFGPYNKQLLIRNLYASIPFDYYLAYSSPFDRSFFSETVFEDDMGLGDNINFEKFWDGMIHRMAKGDTNKMDYDAYGRLQKYLVMLACGDLGELKARGKGKLYRHALAYKLAGAGYRGLKRLYHKFYD